MRASANVLKRAQVSRNREHIEWPVDGGQMPLIARRQETRTWKRLRAPTVRTKDVGVDFREGCGKPSDIVARCGDHDVEVQSKPLAAVCLDRDPTDGHVLDVVSRQRPEKLTGVERPGVVASLCHSSGTGRLVTVASPARSSAATLFQLSASSKRSDMGRRRAASTAFIVASGSRTCSTPEELAMSGVPFNERITPGYRPGGRWVKGVLASRDRPGRLSL
jgi:hypothetical protein